MKAIEYHQFALRRDAAKILSWNGRHPVALYHPSPQVIASHRREREQLEDFGILKLAIDFLENSGALKNKDFG